MSEVEIVKKERKYTYGPAAVEAVSGVM